MTLKPNFDTILFFKSVQQCSGEVWFYTAEGDRLNLKSVLSQFLFSTLLTNKTMLSSGLLKFENMGDRVFLEPFCMKESTERLERA